MVEGNALAFVSLKVVKGKLKYQRHETSLYVVEVTFKLHNDRFILLGFSYRCERLNNEAVPGYAPEKGRNLVSYTNGKIEPFSKALL